MRNRAFRRKQLVKRKLACKKRVRDVWRENPDALDVNCLASVRGKCSCPMCGNPRRHFGELTIQERKQGDRHE